MPRFTVPTIVALALLAQVPAAAQSPLAPERERALKPKDEFKECDVCPRMVVVPAGTFLMGSPSDEEGRNKNEGPVHEVAIANPFAVGTLKVTVDQFEEFVRATGHRFPEKCWTRPASFWGEAAASFRKPGFLQTAAHPVVCAGWRDAGAYVAWLSSKTGKRYRLLTEAEWEYVARAGTQSTFPWNAGRLPEEFGNCTHCTKKWNNATLPAGSFKANAFGLFDILGNASELLEDCYMPSYAGSRTDGSARATGVCESRVIRGASWSSFPYDLRPARRSFLPADDSILMSNLGFRVARALGN